MRGETRGYYSITWADDEPTRITGWCAGCGLAVSESDYLLVASEPLEFPVFDARPPFYTIPKPAGVWHAACAGAGAVPDAVDGEVTYSGMRWRMLTRPPLAPTAAPRSLGGA